MLNPITAETITVAQIRALRDAALDADDNVVAELCDVALAAHERHNSVGYPLVCPMSLRETTRSEARAYCADLINASRE